MSEIQSKVSAAFSSNGGQDPPNNGQFSQERFAFLFKPGSYEVDVPVGYYTSVAGMGETPDEVVFTSDKGVYCEEGGKEYEVGALDTFWRSAEGFKTNAKHQWWNGAAPGMLWAVSQAAPLRRVHVMHNLWFAQYQLGNIPAGYASGGFCADSVVEGKAEFMSQQQFLMRNTHASNYTPIVWNGVFVGATGGVPAAQCPKTPVVSVEPSTPQVAEKPYIVANGDQFSLHVPPVMSGTRGPSWQGSGAKNTVISFENVYVATDTDSAATINEKLECENVQALVLTAGIYNLEAAIRITKPNFVVLGLGMATLIPTQGNACIEVAGGIGNVRLASVLLEAGKKKSQVLLDWGSTDSSLREAPASVISDLFTRNGGPNNYQTAVDTFVHIKTNNVIGDNLWLWVADHSVQGMTTSGDQFPTQHGLVVDGDNVIMYGLAVEHTLQTLTVWNGNAGQTYFYQSELPYAVFSSDFGERGYVGYHVSDSVKSHRAVGLGVYTNFYHPNAVKNAITAPSSAIIESAITVHLNNLGSIEHVANGQGAAVNSERQTSVVCNVGPKATATLPGTSQSPILVSV